MIFYIVFTDNTNRENSSYTLCQKSDYEGHEPLFTFSADISYKMDIYERTASSEVSVNITNADIQLTLYNTGSMIPIPKVSSKRHYKDDDDDSDEDYEDDRPPISKKVKKLASHDHISMPLLNTGTYIQQPPTFNFMGYTMYTLPISNNLLPMIPSDMTIGRSSIYSGITSTATTLTSTPVTLTSTPVTTTLTPVTTTLTPVTTTLTPVTTTLTSVTPVASPIASNPDTFDPYTGFNCIGNLNTNLHRADSFFLNDLTLTSYTTENTFFNLDNNSLPL